MIFIETINELFKTKYPLIQGGMANIATAEFASAVSNAGALGLIGAGGNDVNWVRNEIRKIKKLTSNPFGVNVMLLNPHAAEIAKMIVEEGVKIVTTGAGSPAPYMEMWKEAGIIVVPVVASVAHATRMERIGADAVVVEGMEAGGHIGRQTTISLVPQVVDKINIPVIAAGGIADYRGVLAAFSLGAKGVQVGTVLLASTECPIHQNYKDWVVSAKDTETTVTNWEGKAPVRVFKNEMAVKYIELSKTNTSFEELEKLTLGSFSKAVFDGNLTEGSFMAGQIAGLVKEIKPVKEIIEAMFLTVDDYKDSIKIMK